MFEEKDMSPKDWEASKRALIDEMEQDSLMVNDNLKERMSKATYAYNGNKNL